MHHSADLIQELSFLFRALGDESRLSILFLLKTHGPLSVSALGKYLKQQQPAISHHLVQLKTAGLIESRRKGRFNIYALSENGLKIKLRKFLPKSGASNINLAGLDIWVNKSKKEKTPSNPPLDLPSN